MLAGPLGASAKQPDAAPVNPDATPEARALLRRIDNVSGKGILSGVHNYPNTVSRYSDRVYELTGKYPAVFGQDFGFSAGEDKDSTLSRSAVVREVIRQYRSGSIPALCWHAVRPTEDEPVTFQGSILGKLTDWEFQQLITPGTELHERWERQVDRIAGYLRALQDAGVPVLFRPYHEMNGNWFWWGGRPGRDGTAALYRMIFDRYVHVHHLNNLVWVWNVAASSSKAGLPQEYWPGADSVDIVSMDIYRPFTQSDYDSMVTIAGEHKPIALAEVGTLPTQETLARQPRWAYFMVWSEFAEDHNTPDQLRSVFNDAHVFDRGVFRLPLPGPAAVVAPQVSNLPATSQVRALLASMHGAMPGVVEVDLNHTNPQTLAATLQHLRASGKVPLLRWSPESPTGKSKGALDNFEWAELRRKGSSLHAAWLAEIDAVGALLQATQHTPFLFSPLPGGDSEWWNRPGPEGTQALLREVRQRVEERHLDDLLWVWETSSETRKGLSPAETLEANFPGLLGVDVLLLNTNEDPSIRDGMLQGLREIALGRPVGLRAPKATVGGLPYDFLVLTPISVALGAQAPNVLTASEKAQGWTLLWDGKTGSGWHTAGGDTIPNANWTIVNGELRDHADGGHAEGHSGDLLTDGDYTDFELSVDFKIAPGANSGIKYFVNPDKASGGDPTIGLEYQLLDDERHPDAKLGRNGNRTEASLYDLIAAPANKPYRQPGQWNTARIVVRGPHTEHWLNGVKILEFERFTPQFRQLVQESKYKTLPNFGELHHGHIQLQDHGDTATFRNIKIRPLK